MLERIETHDVGPSEHMTIDFAPRFNLFTGDNGVGKSFVLELAWWCLTGTWTGFPAMPFKGRYKKAEIGYSVVSKAKRVTTSADFLPTSMNWRGKVGRPVSPGLVVYMRLDGSFSIWDPLRNYYKNAPSQNVVDLDRPKAFHFTKRELWDGLDIDGVRVCNGIVEDLVFWQLERPPALELLERALAALSPSEADTLSLGRPVRDGFHGSRRVPTLREPYGEIPLTIASEAVKRMLGLCYSLTWAIDENRRFAERIGNKPETRIIFLIDEIEAHLHPKWQRRILPAVFRFVEDIVPKARVQIMAVTHSPLVLASIEADVDAGRDRLFGFDIAGDAGVVVHSLDFRKRGDASAWLRSEVFGLPSARAVAAERAIQDAESLLNADRAVSDQEFETMEGRLAAELPDFDEFWTLWNAERFLRGKRTQAHK